MLYIIISYFWYIKFCDYLSNICYYYIFLAVLINNLFYYYYYPLLLLLLLFSHQNCNYHM